MSLRGSIVTVESNNNPFEADVVSAHRMPDDMFAYAEAAAGRGLKAIIAGAGGAAHLPGMLASVTALPVIGVPVPLSRLDGLDSLLSIVQMPAGVPVATVAIGNARNAGLLAGRILATSAGVGDAFIVIGGCSLAPGLGRVAACLLGDELAMRDVGRRAPVGGWSWHGCAGARRARTG